VREAKTGLGFSGLSGGAGRSDAGGVAGDLKVVGRGDDYDAVYAAAPVGEDGFLLAAGAGIANGFEQKSGFNYGDGGGVAGENFVDLLPLEIDDSGMNNGVEFLEAAAGEGELGKAGAVEFAVGSHDLAAEDSDDFRKDGLTGLHELAAKSVGFDDVGAAFAKHGGDGALTTAEAAGEAYA
jgi:hypothetical protein